MATPQELLSALAKAYSISRDTSFEGPAFDETLEKVRDIQGALGWVMVRLGDEGFDAGGRTVPGGNGELLAFREALEEAGIREMRLQTVLDQEVLADFLQRVGDSQGDPEPLPSARFRGLGTHLGLSFRKASAELPGMVGAVQGLFGPSSPAATESFETTGEPTPDLVPDGIPTSTESVEPSHADIADEIRSYLDNADSDRKLSEIKIRAWAAELAKAREVGAIGEMVQALVEPQEDRPADWDAVELGRELATAAVASHFVARLGHTKDEVERARLVKLLSAIGREGAFALADALGESRDRSQRRAFMNAMGSMGPHGLERAQRMVEDPRWFVVRNGVALLGEYGGEDAVGYLTGALANEDPRVRKESVLSLAKLGGRDAEALLVGMLEDGDPSVRAATCRALGILKSSRSVRPLVDVLRDESVDVQVEGLQALGQIGDPGVVRTIEKRAFGGLFSKAPREVRIAAFRALAGIGTPGALRALEKGANDPDQTVRTVARTLIGNR